MKIYHKPKSQRNNPKGSEFSEEKYKLLSDLMGYVPDVIYFKDRKGRLIMVNKAHAKGLGLEPEEVVGKTDFDFFPVEKAKKMAKDDMYVIKTGKPIIDKIERATRADGVDNYVSTTKIPRYDNKGRIIGLIGITRDITNRMQLESLREDRVRLERKLEVLEEINKMKSEFVSVVSHEIRTPLAVIKEAIMLLLDEIVGTVNEKQKSLLRKAVENIERLVNIVEELLDISRIESGQIKFRYSLVNLNDLLLNSLDFFNRLANEKGLDLSYSLPKKQVNIFIDANRISQVFANLINNAIKFTEKNGKIKIEVRILQDKVRVGVMDTGVGIATQDIPKLFRKFSQVTLSDGQKKEGVGLGLSIVKDLIEKHGGEIWVESTPGVGSKFYFTLPRYYTESVLNKTIRDQINNLLYKGIPVYLINLLIVNFSRFKTKVKINPHKLFKDLKVIINDTLDEFFKVNKGEAQIAFSDYSNGEFSVIFPKATEEPVLELCKMLKDLIYKYFINKKIKNIFINLGMLSYTPKDSVTSAQQLLANLYLKKIYIGSEIRRFKRVDYKADIEAVLNKENIQSTKTIDISVGGLCFFSNKPLKIDSKVDIKLWLLKSKKPITTRGRIAWLSQVDKPLADSEDRYKVGLEFINLKPSDKKIINKLIESVAL